MRKYWMKAVSCSLWLTVAACGGGAVGSNPNAATNSELAEEGTTQEVGLKIGNKASDDLDKWWKSRQVTDSYKTDLVQAVADDKFGVFLGNLVDNLVSAAFTSIASQGGLIILQWIISQHVTKVDVEKIRYENIMDQLNLMDQKLTGLMKLSSSTLQMTTSFSKRVEENAYKAILSRTNNLDAKLKKVFNRQFTVNKQTIELGDAYATNKLDFMLPTPNGNLVVNDTLLKIIFYKSEQDDFDDIFDPTEMQQLDKDVEELSAVNDSYLKLVVNKETNEKTFELDRSKILVDSRLMHNYLEALGDDIYSNVPTFSVKSNFTYQEMKDTNFKVYEHNNQLVAYGYYYNKVQEIRLQVLKTLARMQKIQYYSLVVRYLVGNPNIAVPNKIASVLNADEQELMNIENNKSLPSDQRKQKIIDLRKAMFATATKLLNISYMVRGEFMAKIFEDHRNYGKLNFGTMALKPIAAPDWDFWRGGLYYNNGNVMEQVETVVDSKAADFPQVYYLDTKGGRHTPLDLVKNGVIYWDGKYLRTVAIKNRRLDLSKVYMQNLATVCLAEKNYYQLDLVADMLYCPADNLNYRGVQIGKFMTANALTNVYLEYGKGFNEQVSLDYFYPLTYKGPNADINIYALHPTQGLVADRLRIAPSLIKYDKDNLYSGNMVLSYPTSFINTEYERLATSFAKMTINLRALNDGSLVQINRYGYIPIVTGAGIALLVINPGDQDSKVALGYFQDDFYINTEKPVNAEIFHTMDGLKPLVDSQQFLGGKWALLFSGLTYSNTSNLKHEFILSNYLNGKYKDKDIDYTIFMLSVK